MRKTFPFILCALGVQALFSSSAMALVIYYNDANSGETSMAQGIAKTFQEKTQLNPELVSFKEESDNQRLSVRLEGPKDTLLLIGKDAFPVLRTNGAALKGRGWKLAHATHQFFEDHPDAVDSLDAAFLPGYLQGTGIQEDMLPNVSKVVWTNGVAFDLPTEEVDKAYQSYQLGWEHLKNTVVLYLAGDAPDSSGFINRYKPDEAKHLVAYVADQHPGSHVVVINGPRTGRYDDKKREIQNVHRGDAPVDEVTQTTSKALAERGHIHTVYDFRFGKESMYRPLLGLLADKGGIFYLPGESNSAITDVIALGLQGRTVVYNNGAMNNLHHANVKYAYKNQGITYMDEDFRLHKASSAGGDQPNPNEQIVEALMKLN